MGIPVLWRTKKARYSLQGEICPECEQAVFPPRRLCPYCGRAAADHTPALFAEPQRHKFVFMMPESAELVAAGDD
jgi:rRNA maturation protein Nop10